MRPNLLHTHGAPRALSLRGFSVNTLDHIHDSLKITDDGKDGKEIYWSVDKSTWWSVKGQKKNLQCHMWFGSMYRTMVSEENIYPLGWWAYLYRPVRGDCGSRRLKGLQDLLVKFAAKLCKNYFSSMLQCSNARTRKLTSLFTTIGNNFCEYYLSSVMFGPDLSVYAYHSLPGEGVAQDMD